MKKGVYILKNFPAARAKWSNLNGFDTNEIFPLRGLKRYEILEEKGICIQKIFSAARAKWVRNPIRITDTEVHCFVFPWPL